MLRINTPTADTGGHFRQGDPDHGVLPTQLSALWCENVQEELASVIESQEIVLDGGARNQLYLAIQSIISSTGLVFPAGALMDYAGPTVPRGWLECLGQVQLIAACPGLYAAIGNTFNVGTESAGFFRLPDFQGRMAVGAGSGAGLTVRALAQTGGEEAHVLTESELAPHTHGYTTKDRTAEQSGDTTQCWVGEAAATTDSAGDGVAHNNMPPFVVARKLIKLGQFDTPE